MLNFYTNSKLVQDQLNIGLGVSPLKLPTLPYFSL